MSFFGLFAPKPEQAAQAAPADEDSQAKGQALVPCASHLAEASISLLARSREAEAAEKAATASLSASKELAAGIASLGAESKATLAASGSASQQAHASADALSEAVETLRGMAAQARQAEEGTRGLTDLISSIERASSSIATIAQQTNLLSLNAAIEAARAGESGRGFAVVADEVRKLAGSAQAASAEISALAKKAATGLSRAESASSGLGLGADSSLAAAERAKATALSAAGQAAAARDSATNSSQLCERAAEQAQSSRESSQSAADTAAKLRDAAAKSSKNAMERSRMAIHALIDLRWKSDHFAKYKDMLEGRDRVQAMLEAAIAQGSISMAALSDPKRTPIPGTDPVQYTSAFDAFMDRELPHIQEEVKGRARNTIFAMTLWRDSYIPTHNAAYSKPQTGDYAHNFAWSRTKRIFSDNPYIAKAAANVDPYLAQPYPRDTGETLFMLAAPLHVQGRHLGAFVIGYTED